MDRLDEQKEKYLSFVEPLLVGLGSLPDNVVIAGISKNTEQEIEVALTTSPGVSMASLFMEYPPLPFSPGVDGHMREPNADNPDEPVYSGVLIEQGKSLMHWQSSLGGAVVNFMCQTDAVTMNAWNNPSHTGAPVATVVLGDVASTSPWCSIGQDGHGYWAQPLNAAALGLLNKATAWQNTNALSTELRQEFNENIQGISSLASPQAKIVLNALFSWATSDQDLPTKEDFVAWTAPRGNVLAMHSPKDWATLTSGAPASSTHANTAQSKIHMLSERLPNIWRFADEQSLAVICDAMQATQTRWMANQKQAPALHV